MRLFPTFRTILLSLALLSFITRSPASAAILAHDDFSYADGALYGANGGMGWSAIWTGTAMLVSSGKAIGENNATEPKYGSRNFTNPESTTELFVAFDLHAPDSFALNDYWALYLSLGVNLSNLVVGKAPGNNNLLVGLTAYSYSNITIQPGATYHIIAAYDMNQPRQVLWINPDAFDYYIPTTGVSSADVTHLENAPFHMSRVDFITNTRFGFAVDNLVVANTPESVGLLSSAPSQCPCTGDMNADGRRDGLDTQQFINCLLSPAPCPCADMNNTDGPTLADIPLFVNKLLTAETCP